ncbi:MAG TPA: GspH/FimT family pseudopilin [Candidatus Methylomirabilis sp.]|nr:GspH/FimT family pseudopilin [Candidatus Methylomirabilis sp.]HSC69926.1 GspH/FimT family pseudopilin [Candidatus Methylomirabilis sp.]
MLAKIGRHESKARGMTVVELLTLMVVVVMLAAFAIPGMSPVILRQRLRGAAWQVAGDLRLARQRAVTERRPFRVCLSSCAISVPAGGYSIERKEGSWISDTGAPVRLPQDVTVTSTLPQATFSTNGMVTPSPTFTVSNVIGSYEIAIASTGRVKVCKGTCP